jgi:hypothetical protein
LLSVETKSKDLAPLQIPAAAEMQKDVVMVYNPTYKLFSFLPIKLCFQLKSGSQMIVIDDCL